MLASLSRRPGYQQITEKQRFDFLKQVHVMLTCHAVLDVLNKHLSSANTFRQPDSKNDKSPPGRPRITTPLEGRVLVT